MEKHDKNDPREKIKVNIKCVNHVNKLLQLIWCDKYATLPLWSSSQMTFYWSNLGKYIRRTPFEWHATRYLSNLHQAVKIIKVKRSQKNCHNQQQPKKTRQQNVMWHASWDPGTEKILQENEEKYKSNVDFCKEE